MKSWAPAARILLGLTLLGLAGCRAACPWPAALLAGPGWKIWQGQAVWRPVRRMPELAGDVMVAVNTNGEAFVQFSKTVPFAVARLEGEEWRVEFPVEGRVYCGHRPLPRHFAWLQLPAVVSGGALSDSWRAEGERANWRLENPRTGETLSGYLAQ